PRPRSDAHGSVLGGGGTVVKANGAENALAPPAFVALTRQKYCVPSTSPEIAAEVPTIPCRSTTVPAKAALGEARSRELSAPAAAFHGSVGASATLTAPSAGELSVGAAGAGGGTVVKRNTAENALLPFAFCALTRQKYCVLFAKPESAAEVATI